MNEIAQDVNTSADASTSPGIGHNGGPPLRDRNFKKRWALALFNRQDKPAGAVAMGFKLYMEMDSQGAGAAISDAEFQVACGVSDGSCRVFKRWLRDSGFVVITVRGRRGYRSEFRAVIPGEELPAAIAGIKAEKTQSQPATIAGISENAAGNPAQDAPACVPAPVGENTTRATKESPSEIVLSEDSVRATPHMNGVGFVISGERKAIIPADTVERWRARFPNIPDLEAAMQRLSCNLLSNAGHPGWSCPEAWMVGILANMNQDSKARTQKGQLPAWREEIRDKNARMRAAIERLK